MFPQKNGQVTGKCIWGFSGDTWMSSAKNSQGVSLWQAWPGHAMDFVGCNKFLKLF